MGPEPFYFAADGRVLFGVFDPAEGARRDVGVLICQPLDPEYARCHRSLRQLAAQLARAGFDVLRFDFSATGDSTGEPASSRLEHWRGDLAAAATALRQRSRSQRLALGGLRVAATIAAAGGLALPGLAAVALWEPLPSGAAYLEALVHHHQQPTLDRLRFPPVTRGADGFTEILGLPFSDALLADLKGLELAALAWPSALAGLVLVNAASSPGAKLAAACGWPEERVTTELVPAQRVWDDDEQALVPRVVIERIVAWTAQQF